MWDIFISNQKYDKAKFSRIDGDKEKCLEFIKYILNFNGVADGEYGIESIKISENQIDYYGMTKDGSNLILAAFKVD